MSEPQTPHWMSTRSLNLTGLFFSFSEAMLIPLAPRLAARDDGHRGRRPQASGAGGDHLLGRLRVADAAGRFDAHQRPDRLAHQPDVLDGGAAAAEARRGLHKVRPGLLG